jgi:hypothetical protein
MEIVGYVYSGGYALCTEHADDLSDPDAETGKAYPIFDFMEDSYSLVCDVPGCGPLMEHDEAYYEEEDE